jgi:hypothetical protein
VLACVLQNQFQQEKYDNADDKAAGFNDADFVKTADKACVDVADNNSNTDEGGSLEIEDDSRMICSARHIRITWGNNSDSSNEVKTQSQSEESESNKKQPPPYDCLPVLDETRVHELDSVCLCGRTDGFKGPIGAGWLQCDKCKEVSHAFCAGFHTEEDILKNTRDEYFDASRCQACSVRRQRHGSTRTMSRSSTRSTTDDTSLVTSRATLIITPTAILDQWQREIRRHTTMTAADLKVVVYPGVRAMCGNMTTKAAPDMTLSHPLNLANADIVLTTYENLMVRRMQCSLA